MVAKVEGEGNISEETVSGTGSAGIVSVVAIFGIEEVWSLEGDPVLFRSSFEAN
jgi:hypothetical protein